MKSLEEELHIKIFERSKSGIYLTGDGAEFVRYASQTVQQNDLVMERYKIGSVYQKLRIVTQHYDFVADVFSNMLNVLITTQSYTIGTGIMPSTLNEGKIISIPLESDTYYNIGYILHTDRKRSVMAQNFVEMLKKELTL